MRRSLALTVVLLLLVATGATACGGDDDGGGGGSVEKGAWVADVCTAITDWAGGLQEVGTEIADSISDPSDLEGARDAIVSVFDTAVESTDTMLDAVEEAGSPDVEDGEALAQDFLDALRPAKAVFEDGLEEAENLPVDDAEAFTSAAGDLSSSIDEGFTAVGEGLEELEEKYGDVDLESSFQDEPACAGIE